MRGLTPCERSGAAPVAVFAFRRLDLLRRTLGALERCEGFGAGPVVVYSDAARPSVPGEERQVAALREWLRRWCGRHGAELREAAVNRGLRASIIGGVTELTERYGRVVVLEDDIVVSRHFLRFMNDGLTGCERRDAIFQISGYFVPHRRRLPMLGLLGAPACWGWGTWRRAWRWYNDDAAALYAQVLERDTHAFDINGTYHNLEALRRNAEGSLDTWGVRWYASMFLRGGMVAYPELSLTRNIGFGGGGTNCGTSAMDRIYLRQRIARGPARYDWTALGDAADPRYADALEEFYRFQHRQWTLTPWPVRLRAKLARLLGR
jgi:hypothetical protein